MPQYPVHLHWFEAQTLHESLAMLDPLMTLLSLAGAVIPCLQVSSHHLPQRRQPAQHIEDMPEALGSVSRGLCHSEPCYDL